MKDRVCEFATNSLFSLPLLLLRLLPFLLFLFLFLLLLLILLPMSLLWLKKRSQGSFFVLLSLLSFRLLPAFF